MGHRVMIPTPLRPYTQQRDAVEAEGETVGAVLSSLTSQYEELRHHLYGDDGKLRHFVNVYVNDDDIRYLQTRCDTPQSRRRDQHRPLGCRRRSGVGGQRAGRRRSDTRRIPALQPSSDPPRSGIGRSAQAEGRPCAVDRRGWSRIAGRAVPRRRGRRHDWTRRRHRRAAPRDDARGARHHSSSCGPPRSPSTTPANIGRSPRPT